jgi:hypothetical protein
MRGVIGRPVVHTQPEQPDRLREAILAKVGPEVGWSVRAADRLGVNRTTVSEWVCGIRSPSIVHFVAISQLTGRSLDWLVRGKEP